MKLNDKGQCPVCKRKPLRYTGGSWRNTKREFFCAKCDRSFDLDTGEQMENWAWKRVENEWGRMTKAINSAIRRRDTAKKDAQ